MKLEILDFIYGPSRVGASVYSHQISAKPSRLNLNSSCPQPSMFVAGEKAPDDKEGTDSTFLANGIDLAYSSDAYKKQ